MLPWGCRVWKAVPSLGAGGFLKDRASHLHEHLFPAGSFHLDWKQPVVGPQRERNAGLRTWDECGEESHHTMAVTIGRTEELVKLVKFAQIASQPIGILLRIRFFLKIALCWFGTGRQLAPRDFEEAEDGEHLLSPTS